MRTPGEAEAYARECGFALTHLFDAINERHKVLRAVAEELAQLRQAQDFARDLFVQRDQWSPNANYHYGQYVQRMERLSSQRGHLESDAGKKQRVEQLLARSGRRKSRWRCSPRRC